MGIIKEKINQDVRRDLQQVVNRAAEDTVATLFGSILCVSNEKLGSKSDELVVRVDLKQGVEGITLRLVFDYEFILTVVVGYYSSEAINEQERGICEDAACELANIICNQIKRFLNEQGLLLFMDLPAIETAESVKEQGRENILDLYFSLMENQVPRKERVLSIGVNYIE